MVPTIGNLMAGSFSTAANLIVTASMPKLGLKARITVKIGFLAPLTGDLAAWGQPGLDGCRIWADWVNALGGVSASRPLRSSWSLVYTAFKHLY